MILIVDKRFFQNLRPVYISCRYFKFDKKIFYFLSFPGVIFLRVLTEKLGGLSNFTHFPLTDYF